MFARYGAVAKRATAWLGDHINPILVKETRQALKSRQFIITFSLLLIAAWAWTLVSVAWGGSEMWYGAKGRDVFFGYYLVLAFPLLVIVPFGALRSLAGEHEDRTYDLLSITTLGPRQIVSGKLGSAAVQMLIYLSAISPCLAFTYLLRGIDVLTIFFILTYTALASLGLAMIGLVIGTLSSEKHWQVVLGVLAVAALMYGCAGMCALTMMFLTESARTFDDPEFWQVCGAMLTAYVSYFALFFFAAAARLMFTSGNRATALRVVMLVQQLLLTGWLGWIWIGPEEGDPTMFIALLLILALHWYAMGVFMTGESPELSLRVKRSLPQSFLGRAFLTWFDPGPGTGYLFALSGYAGGLAMMVVGIALLPGAQRLSQGLLQAKRANADLWRGASGTVWWQSSTFWSLLTAGFLGLCYLTIYLGLGVMVLRFLRRFTQVGVLLTLLVHFLLVIVGVFVPLLVQMLFTGGELDYSLAQITNAPWTTIHVLDRGPRNLAPETPAIAAVLGVMALGVFLLNLLGVAREVRQVRIARPLRVETEDAALRPVKPVATSPWG